MVLHHRAPNSGVLSFQLVVGKPYHRNHKAPPFYPCVHTEHVLSTMSTKKFADHTWCMHICTVDVSLFYGYLIDHFLQIVCHIAHMFYSLHDETSHGSQKISGIF